VNNGSERLDRTGGRRLTIAGVGLVEILPDCSVRTPEPLSPEQQERLRLWLENELPQNRLGMTGYESEGSV
jgi:hypothetical protein